MPFSSLNILFLFLLCLGMSFTEIEASISRDDSALRRLKTLFETPENEIDFTGAKITIDHIIAPSQNSEEVTAAIDEMVQKIQVMTGDNAPATVRLGAIRKYLYEKGPWNDYQAFQYDFTDPMGTNISSKLLSHYIETKKGNCVSMPMLFIILADKMGLDVSASTAPNHVLIKFTDPETNATFNIEATSGGGFARDKWYQEQMNITDKALQTGIYLQKLTRRETLAVMAITVGEFYLKQNQFTKALEVFELVLKFYPKSVFSMLKAGSSYSGLIERDFLSKYKNTSEIPIQDQKRLYEYLNQNRSYFSKAESLGWQEPTNKMSNR
ncbi:MAG: tetratricopeptide repeat protein [Oligoflexus sp.]